MADYISTTKVYENEIVKESDCTYANESAANNISVLSRLFSGEAGNIVIGGTVTPGSGMNLNVSPIFAINHSSKNFAGNGEKAGPIAVTDADASADRVDILEVKGFFSSYDTEQRAFNDPNTSAKTYDSVYVKENFAVDYKVKAGTPGTVTAPAVDDGYIKIAEIRVAANATELVVSNICNITADQYGAENTSWTTEKTSVYRVGYLNEIRDLIRSEHNTDGTHKDHVIHVNNIDMGTGSNQLCGNVESVGIKITLGGSSYDTTTTISTLFTGICAAIDGKAPTNHASDGTGYGIATTDLYGHAKASASVGKALAVEASAGTANGIFANADHTHPLPALTSCTGVLTLEKGGTGATTAADARTALGIGKVDNTADADKSVASAAKLTTARTIYISDSAGNYTGVGVSFDGTGDVTLKLPGTISISVTSANYATSAGSASTVSQIAAAGATATLVSSTMADNDYFRILTGGDTNAGYAEIATGDDATEPIYVRQYTGIFTTLVRTLTLLDGSGNTSFPGSVTASSFIGALNGTASYANSAGSAPANGGNSDTVDGVHFSWTGNGGQPTWLWGGLDSTHAQVWNPSNFSVNYATSAGSASANGGNSDTVDGYHAGTSAGMLIPVSACSLGASSGYIKLANGLLIQWGTGTSAVSGSWIFTFPIAFKSWYHPACFQNANLAESTKYFVTGHKDSLAQMSVACAVGTSGTGLAAATLSAIVIGF